MIDELDLLAEWRADVAEPTAEAEGAAREALAARIAAERAPVGRYRWRWAWRPAMLAGGMAAAIAVVLVSLLGSGTSGPTPAVAATFERLARAASAQAPLRPLTAGHYLFVESIEFQEADAPEVGCVMLMPEHRRIWIGADGSGRLLETFGQPSYTSAADRARCAHVPSGSGTDDTWFAPRCLTNGPTNLATLPTDPARLGEELRARKIEGGPAGPGEDFVQVGDLLRETDAPPALRAALYRVAETIPGVRVLGPVHDARGRPGLGIVYGPGKVHSELIVDPHTGVLLAERVTAPGQPAEWSLYLRTVVVSHIPGHSPRPLRPACVNGGGPLIQTPSGVGVQVGPAAR